jgi:diguanylate cyclase (GGDEF)-like protein
MASHDVLTDLPNRYAFRERIREALRECEASRGMLTVMCLDLDNFKEVNDTLGHPTGDALLCAAAERLARTVRETDMVARFGGDEFAILQPRIDRLDDAERLAQRLVEAMRKPFIVKGETIYATATIGVAVAPGHGSNPDALQKNADLALYAAKADGKRTYRLFEGAMDERVASRHGLERDLRVAVAENQFEVYYQPIVRLKSGKMTGLEALLRWRHPVHGMISPARFIPVAEEAGLINEIGRWVLAQACADAARWPAHLKVSVNLSVAQFTQGDIVDDIRRALSRAGLRPERLVAEITESLLLTENADTLETLRRLKALRVDIAMDDFGTGYSSLNYLNKYSFDRIKIDRDFISGANKSEKTSAVIKAIVQLGAALGMTTVAEGIESEADLAMLIAAGCEEGQGYLFSKPVPRAQLQEVIDGDLGRQIKVA